MNPIIFPVRTHIHVVWWFIGHLCYSVQLISKVYGFSQTINSMQGNGNAEVSPQTIFMSVFLCMLLRLGSFRQLASDAKSGKVRKVPTQN